MVWFKRIVIGTLIFVIFAFFHYSLPSRDIVRIVGTDVKRMDVGTGSWFWAEADAGSLAGDTRDVRFVDAVWPNGNVRVYRNEDTNWGWPPYLKFDSGNLNAEAKSLVSGKDDPQWVAVTHYGWRFKLLSMFPNVIGLKPVDGPDVTLIPWFNIIFLTLLGALILWIWRFFRRLKQRHVDPVLENVTETADDFMDGLGDTASAARQRATGAGTRLGRWIDTWRPKHKRRYRD